MSPDHPRDILSLSGSPRLWVPQPQSDNQPIAVLEWNCEWEVEHGMLWIIREDQVFFVGPANLGESLWGDFFFGEDEFNYA